MTVDKRKKNAAPASQHPADDLSLIKGIGPARQQWLRDVFGVHTFGDLANLTVDEIQSQLKKGQVVSRSDIASWIEQADQLTGRQKPRKPPENGWHPIASFVVEYQKNERMGMLRTTVHHMEADKTLEWPGVEYDEVFQWMVQQLGEEGIQTGARVPATETELSEEVQQVLTKAGDLLAEQPVSPLLVATPSPQPTMPASGVVSGFSKELQQIITKTATMTQSRQPVIKPVYEAPAKPAVMPATGFSEALQQRIARAQRVAAGKKSVRVSR